MTFLGITRTIALALCLGAPLLVAQSPALRIEGAGQPATSLTLDALRRLPTDTVSFSAHGAPAVRYRAVRLSDVLAAAGQSLDSMHIGHEAQVVIVVARDAYLAVFSASELDPKLGPTRAWLAFEREAGPLTAEEGPFRLVVPTDAKASRSAHQATTIRVIDAQPPGTKR